MEKIIVIGAGASGLMAAIAAAREGASVTILEGMDKPGKKLLTTGNGRCNLTNLAPHTENYYRGADKEFICTVLNHLPADETCRFFQELGLLLHDRNGYVYPYVDQASAVLDVLLMEVERLGIKVKYREKVSVIKQQHKNGGNIWQVMTDTWKYEADAVIVCAGSMAASVTGSDGSGYKLAEMTGHPVISPLQALVPLKIKEKWIRSLSGLRMAAEIKLIIEDKKRGGGHKRAFTVGEKGELQWTDYGISGIVVFQLSRYAVRALERGSNVTAVINLMPAFDGEMLRSYILSKNHSLRMEQAMTGILPRKAIRPLLELSGIRASQMLGDLAGEQLEKLICNMQALKLTVCGAKGFDAAQTCSGGVDSRQINPLTMESRLCGNLYFAGEIIDVDGACGGYNLQWAWSSGYAAGMHASSKQRKDRK